MTMIDSERILVDMSIKVGINGFGRIGEHIYHEAALSYNPGTVMNNHSYGSAHDCYG